MNRFFLIPLTVLGLMSSAQADDLTLSEAQNRLTFGGVFFNPLGEDKADHRSGVHFELRMAEVHVWKLHPFVGIEFDQKDGFWVGAGLETDIDITDSFVLTFQTGPGYMDDGTQHQHYNIYPGPGLMFRSSAELAYRIPDTNDARIGINISHYSNAKLAGNSNPGVETVGVNFHVPMDFMGGK